MPPIYDLESVQHMIDELTNVGIKSLETPEEVDEAIVNATGTSLVIINSVCGCAAGNCRPGVALALQNGKIPDNLYTVFAGVHGEAVDRTRALMPNVQPSSPNIALFKEGSLIGILQRSHIENMSAEDISKALTKVFDENCDREGPSVSKEIYEQNEHKEQCGSEIPLYQED